MGRGDYRLFQKVNMSCKFHDKCPQKKNTKCPIHFFDEWAAHYANTYVRFQLRLNRRAESNSKNTRWENPDPGYYDDAVSHATVLLYENKELIQSARYPKACARGRLRTMCQHFTEFTSSGWRLSEWDQRQLTKARSEVDSSHPNADEGERDRLVRECYINNGGNASVFDTIYGQPLQLFDEFHPEGGIDVPDERYKEYQTWDADMESDPADEVVGQRSFMDFLEEECDETQRDFLELCAGRTDTQVSEILHENVSSTNRRKKKLLEDFKSWVRAAGENSS